MSNWPRHRDITLSGSDYGNLCDDIEAAKQKALTLAEKVEGLRVELEKEKAAELELRWLANERLKERDEARKVARESHQIAKRHHIARWGRANADEAYRNTEEKNPWLRKREPCHFCDEDSRCPKHWEDDCELP